MKKTLILALSISCFSAYAQTTEAEKQLLKKDADVESGWKKGGTINTALSQVSLTNWAAGGQNSISANGLLSLFAHYKKDAMLWENYLDFAYGTNQQGKGSDWLKTDDKVDFTSKFGQKASEKWYYAGLVNLKSQMTPGYNYPNTTNKISDFMAPGYFLGAMGMDFKPSDKFTAFLSPITGKITIVNDDGLSAAGAFGVEPGKKSRSEFGGYARFFFKHDIMTNVTLQTKLDLFSNYLDNPQHIDVNWETLISLKINKYISATITTHLIYDHDIDIVLEKDALGNPTKVGPAIQFKEVLGVGFSYKF
jgi:hypothetical protein